jgi:flagellar motor switch protein FliG
MSLTGKQKAAMLLISLDAATAAEMVRGLDPGVVRELALELAYLDAAGFINNRQSVEIARQFCSSLATRDEFKIDKFLKDLLDNAIGQSKAERIQAEIRDMLHKRDPFIPIRTIDSKTMASILNSEHPQAAAVVLSELPAKKSSEVLGLLNENVRMGAVKRLIRSEIIPAEAKMRIAEMVCRRLDSMSADGQGTVSAAQPDEALRKVAVILRNLGKELRAGLLGAIKEKDEKTGQMVADLMIIWEDVPQIADRSLQEALRGIDSKKLALALHKADETIVKKIRTNISERAAAAVDEEKSLMSAPKKEDIEAAKVELVQILRQINEKGELAFIED